jgi:hypothetical protein
LRQRRDTPPVRNSLRFAESLAARYQLYRVFDFARSPRVYVLTGSLHQSCHLEPVEYLAAI